MSKTLKKAARPADPIPDKWKAEAAHLALCICSALGEIRERAITIGGWLLVMKGRLESGTFTEWVKSDCNLNIRTGQNYMLAYLVTQVCPELERAKSFKLTALYELGRLANTAERQAILHELVAAEPPVKSADVIAQFRMKLGLPEASDRAAPASAPRAPVISQRIEPSLVIELAELLGDRLGDFVTLVGKHGAVAVCDALIDFAAAPS